MIPRSKTKILKNTSQPCPLKVLTINACSRFHKILNARFCINGTSLSTYVYIWSSTKILLIWSFSVLKKQKKNIIDKIISDKNIANEYVYVNDDLIKMKPASTQNIIVRFLTNQVPQIC